MMKLEIRVKEEIRNGKIDIFIDFETKNSYVDFLNFVHRYMTMCYDVMNYVDDTICIDNFEMNNTISASQYLQVPYDRLDETLDDIDYIFHKTFKAQNLNERYEPNTEYKVRL